MSLHHISRMGRPKKNSVRRDQVIIPDQHTHSYSAHFRLEKMFDIPIENIVEVQEATYD